MQICFPDRVYDSTVKPYWNNTCKKLSENLFLLLWLAKKYGKKVIIVNESYTSKTRSWHGIIDENLGSSKTIKEQDIIVDRDINGARGIYLKHVAFAINQPVLTE